MSNQPVNPAAQAAELELQRRNAKNREAVASAGTILVSATGAIYFDLNGKNGERLNDLRALAHDIAVFTHGRVSEGDLHPITNSPATLVIQVGNPKTPQAHSIFHSLASTGNAYAFVPERPTSTFLRFNDVQNPHEVRAFAEKCFKLVPHPDGGARHIPERTLMRLVHNAVALSAVKESVGFNDRVFIPGSLYDRDPVKACLVEAFLFSTAERNRGRYAKENFVNQADNKYTVVHSVSGGFAVQDIMNQLNHSDFMFPEIKNAVIFDMELYSSVAKANIKPPEVYQSGRDILTELGIGGDIEAFGINLGTLVPPKLN